jgi:signal transduction histidine kinase
MAGTVVFEELRLGAGVSGPYSFVRYSRSGRRTGDPVPRLIVIKGADEGKQFELTGERLTAGRDAANRIRLHDTEVSRRHAEFITTTDGIRVVDVGSANGTFVNNQSIRDTLLQPGDHVQIGQTVLVFSAGRGENQPPSDLADRISMITRQDLELSSAIIKSIGDTEGSRILARPENVDGPWLKTALANLGIMYEAIQAVSHILDLNQLLERIMDLIFRSLEADRGCIMLRRSAAEVIEAPAAGESQEPSTSDEFEPKAVRWREGVNRQEKIPISRTIMDYVLKEKKGILVTDAALDERFQSVQSIVRFGIREVICVPMKGRHGTLGVLYLDTRVLGRDLVASSNPANNRANPPTTKFTGDHLALAIAIAHQAALAVEETHYYQAMVQAERLAAVGQTIAALSHHIKNILQGLRSGGEILKMGLHDKDDALLNQGWKMMEKNQGKIYDLVMDMLSYSKEREPNLEDTDVNQIVRDVVELLEGRVAELGVTLTTHLDETLPTCQADPEGVHRALLNIAGNAIDAVEGVAKPQVRIATVREKVGENEEWICIEVRDNGSGIPADKLEDIFRPFVSTKGSRGTGLGLAVSRKILREHGGDIIVLSQVGEGSSFFLRLSLRTLSHGDMGRTRTEIPILPPMDEPEE